MNSCTLTTHTRLLRHGCSSSIEWPCAEPTSLSARPAAAAACCSRIRSALNCHVEPERDSPAATTRTLPPGSLRCIRRSRCIVHSRPKAPLSGGGGGGDGGGGGGSARGAAAAAAAAGGHSSAASSGVGTPTCAADGTARGRPLTSHTMSRSKSQSSTAAWRETNKSDCARIARCPVL